MTRLAVVFTGGTISMLPDPVTGGAVPRLDGAAILARVPGIDGLADLEPVDWGLVPASHLGMAQILELAQVLEGALTRSDIDGAVLVQGTDSMEETAFAFDLLVSGDKPVVVVGAMRNAADPAWDGAKNLHDAVRVAASARWRGAGTLVVMGGRVLAADDATKLHSHADDAFGAPNAGPLAEVVADGAETAFDAEPDAADGAAQRAVRGPRRRLGRIPESAAEPVFLITATVGMDGSALRALTRLAPRGMVVAATGAGNTHPDMLEAGRESIDAGIPLALTSRCVAGGASGAYGFPGGGAAWLTAGAIDCGTLSGAKARIALGLGLGAGLDEPALRALLADPASTA
ncbi:MAG: asparaginase [Chloroflexota bacterium]|nr:asparaginase [Chloroflexota bacterium]